jgi:two-component system, chemotaxis family, response regulator Rcp1
MSSFITRSMEILLVEDSPSDANLMIRSFAQRQSSYSLTWVETGEAAMTRLYQQGKYADVPHPDLILLDLNLPGMDGREVLAAVKSDPSLKHLPVIILTTSAAQEDIRRSYELSANCYITKPIDVQEFIQAVILIQEFWLRLAQLPSKS